VGDSWDMEFSPEVEMDGQRKAAEERGSLLFKLYAEASELSRNFAVDSRF